MDSTRKRDKKAKHAQEEQPAPKQARVAPALDEPLLPRGGARVAAAPAAAAAPALFAALADEAAAGGKKTKKIKGAERESKRGRKQEQQQLEDDEEEEDVTAAVARHGRECKTVSSRSLHPGALLLARVIRAGGGGGADLLLPHGLRCTLEDEEDEGDENDDAEDVEHWAAGDEVAVCVTSAAPLRVSADPALVCQFLPPGAPEAGALVVGRIATVEDRGWTVALPGQTRAAFLPRAQVAVPLANRLRVGRIVSASVVSVAKGAPVQLTLLQSGAAPRNSVLAQLLPGMRVAKAQLARDVRQPEDGYRVSLGDGVTGELHWSQLKQRIRFPLPPFDPSASLRVVWIDPDRAACGVTQLPWLVTPEVPLPASGLPEAVFRATVVSVSNKRGVWLLAEDGTPCHCASSLASDEPTGPALEVSITVGSQLAARQVRETGESFDGSLEVALAPSLLRARWLRPSELPCGTRVSGTVELLRSSGAAVVSLDGSAGRLRGFVPSVHSPRNLTAGQTLPLRVLDSRVVSARRLPLLTGLRLLVNDSEEPLTPGNVKVDRWGWGAVTGLQPAFAIVQFFGGLEALLPAALCSYAKPQSVIDVLKLGQAVRARVAAVDSRTGRVTVSLLEPQSKEAVVELPPMGSLIVGATVSRLVPGAGAELSLPGMQRPGFVSIQHLADFPRLAAHAFSSLVEGATLGSLVAVGHDRRGVLLCSAKPALLRLRESLPKSLAELRDDSVLETMTVERSSAKGALVRLWGDVAVFCHRDRLSDGPEVPSDAPELPIGASLCGRVGGPPDDRGRRVMRCGLSSQPGDLGHFLCGYAAAMRWPSGLRPGAVVAGIVVSTAGTSGVATVRVRGGDLMEHECRVASPLSEWRPGLSVRVALLHADPAAHRLDAMPEAAFEKVARESGVVLFAGEEVCILSSGFAATLCLALAVPEWSSLFVPSNATPYEVGSRWNVVASRHTSADPAWLIAARLAPIVAAVQAAPVAVAPGAALKLGSVYELTVASVAQHHLNVRGASGQRGRIHLSELEDDSSAAPVALLSRFKSGATIRAVYIGYRRRRDKSVLAVSHAHQAATQTLNHHFSLRLTRHASETGVATVSDDDRGEWLASVPVYGGAGVGAGSVLAGVVTEHAPSGLWVHLAPYLRGKLFELDASDDRDIVASLKERMPVGTRLKVSVATVDTEERELDLLRHPPVRTLAEGAVTLCRVNSFKGESALLQYAAHGYARLHELDVDDVVHESSALGMLPEPGGLIYATLIRLPEREFLDATTRPSVTGVPWGDGTRDPAEERFGLLPWGGGAPAVGALVAGRVSSSGKGHDGVFVSLGQGFSARCPLRLVSDEFVETSEVAARFPPGKRVLCRVTRVDAETRRVEIALKASLCRRNRPLLTFDALEVGQVVHCDVNKVDERFGLFLTVRGGQGLTGLAHKSQIFESGTKQDFATVYTKGDYVLAKVLTLDAKQQRVGFTIKASAFTAEEREAMNAGESESGEEEEEAAERKEEEEAVATPAAAVALPPSALPAVGFFEEEEKEKENSSSASSSSSSSSEEEDKKSTRKRERSATAAEVEARESQLARREAVPETDEDFERLLMGAPHSSEVWIRFMSHKLSNADVEAARQIGTRALLRIPSSSHAKERANVWTALTNLEVKFGSDKTLESILARGGSEVGRLEMDCRALDALEREGDKKLEIATEFSAAVLKRHAAAAEAWLRVGQFFIRRGDGAKSGQLLQKGLKQVADKEARILMASRWAQSEFREGSVERGRTIFFSLLDNYPKRIDVMVVFLDMEEKNKHWEAARELYRRATALHLSSKKMRYFLRRWLEFEKLHGDARDQQLVTDTAKAFVESRTKKDDSSE